MKDWTREKLSGVFAPVTTAFKDDKLDLDSLRSNLRKLGETALTGYLALGSNGEFRSLSDAEQLEVLEVFAQEKGEKVVMVGTGCESAKETIEKTEQVAALGFEFASVLTPSYFAKQMDDQALLDFYTRVADNVSIPILIYNAPRFAGGVEISPKALSQLAAHNNIVGMKDSSLVGPNRFLAVLPNAHLNSASAFQVLAGSANFFYPSLHLGAVGGILSLANYLPALCCDLYRLFLEGAYREARDLHFRLLRLNVAVSSVYGVAGVKAAMDLLGFVGGEPRQPLRALTESQKEDICRALIAAGIAVD